MQLVKKVFVGAVTFLGIALAPFTATAGDLQQQLTSESVIQSITKRGKNEGRHVYFRAMGNA